MKQKLYFALVLVILANSQRLMAQNCAVNAGLPQTLCANQTLTLTATTNGPLAGSPNYQWTKLTGPGAVINNPNSLSTTVTNLTAGTYTFQFSARCGDNGTAANNVTITVLPEVTQPNAGPDVTNCNSGAITLTGNAVGAGETGSWSLVTGTGTIGTPSSSTTQFTTSSSGLRRLVWTITNGTCSKSDTVVVSITTPAAVSAGPDQTRTCGGSSVTLAGSSAGLAPHSGLWTQVSGPNTATITNPSQNNSTVTNLVPGVYLFRWAVTGPCLSGADTVQITVNNILSSPNAGGTTNYTQFCSGGATSLVLTAGVPAQGVTGSWVQTSGPAGVTIASPNNYTTVVNGLNGTSTYVFTYTATNGSCSASSSHTIYGMPGVANLSQPANQTLGCNAISTTIQTTYSYSLGTTSAGLTRSGVVLSQPTGPAATITAPSGNPSGTDNWTVGNMRMPGTYVFRLEYRNACSTQHRDVSIVVSRPPAAANAGSDPVIACNATTTFLAGSVPDTSTGSWSQVSGPNTATIVSPNSANTSLTGLVPGSYIFRWVVNGGLACTPKFDEVLVTVASPTVTPAAAGPDTTICNIFPHHLSGNTPGLTQTGTWSVSPSTGVSFSDVNSPTATVFGLAASTQYRFIWTIANNCSSSRDTAFVTTDATSSQMAVNAGADQCLASGTTSIALSGSTTADPLVTRLWIALDGGTIASPTAASTSVTLPGNGHYRFVYQLTKSGCGTVTDTVGVTVNATVTTANAGTDQTLCTASYPASINLTGNAAAVGSPRWTVAVGAAGTSFSAANASSTTVTGLSEGTYVFLYTISNGFCPSSSDSVSVTLGRPPSAANGGADVTSCNIAAGTNVALSAVAPTIGTGYWAVISGPQGSTPTFTNGTSPTGSLSGWSTGVYQLKWTTINSPVCPSSTDTVVATVSASANANALSAGNNYCAINSLLLTGTLNTNGTWTATAVWCACAGYHYCDRQYRIGKRPRCRCLYFSVHSANHRQLCYDQFDPIYNHLRAATLRRRG